MTMARFGPYTVELSNEDKIFFPQAGLTKGDLIAYYRDVAAVMLPHLQNRPLTLQRFPDGIDGEGFFQQDRPDYFPDWIEDVAAERRGDDAKGPVHHVLCNKQATLVYLANQGVITLHTWLARAPEIERPDRLIFDLDPPDDDFKPVKSAARKVEALMSQLGLNPYLMTTGSRGLHVMAPLDQGAGFHDVRDLATGIAGLLSRRHPDELTTEQRKDKRQGRLYVDVMRNAYGQTAVAPYTVRARPNAPVAMPLDWDELDRGDLDPQGWTIENAARRLGQKEDPWAGIGRAATSIDGARNKLDALLDED